MVAANPKHTFPIDNELDYRGRVVFRARTEDYLDLVDAGHTVYQSFASKDNVDPPQRRAEEQRFRAEINRQREQIKRTHPGGSVTMYMPQTLQFSDRIEYTNVDLGIVGGTALAGLQNNERAAQVVQNAIKSGTVGAIESIADINSTGLATEGAQLGAARLAAAVPFAGEELSGAVQVSSGVAVNPNRRSTMRGVGIRRFQFTFKMIPTSQREAIEIENIIDFFRTRMYPSTIAQIESTSNISAGLRFPSKFEIKLKYNDVEKKKLKILPCFLESFNAVYNPNSMSFHSDGRFQETDITMAFLEERALTQEDILKGY